MSKLLIKKTDPIIRDHSLQIINTKIPMPLRNLLSLKHNQNQLTYNNNKNKITFNNNKNKITYNNNIY